MLLFLVVLMFFLRQVLTLFPSSQGLEVIWSSVVKIGQSLYREGPGKDPFRPDQKTPIQNFFLAGSYTKQVSFPSLEMFDYIQVLKELLVVCILFRSN